MFWNNKEDAENKELIMTIIKTKMELNVNIKNYEYAEPEQIDYYLYQIKANKAKLNYLIKEAKEKKIELISVEKIKYEA